MHWKTNVGMLHNLHVSTNGDFEIYRDLYNIPFGTVFLLILVCVGLHVSCLTVHILWGAFIILVIISVSVSISTSTGSMELNKSNFLFGILLSLVTFEDERNTSDVLIEWIHYCQ